MSYVSHNYQEIAIPTWELSKSQLKYLSKKYIIAKYFDTYAIKVRGLCNTLLIV